MQMHVLVPPPSSPSSGSLFHCLCLNLSLSLSLSLSLQSEESKFMIFSDSLSALKALETFKTDHATVIQL